MLLLIASLAAVLYAWDIGHAHLHPLYASAVRSMTESWRAFLFGSLDPGSSITIDKLPGFLWPQALSARIFGFHPWSVTLPQVIEGVLCVLVLYRVVRRWAGVGPALLAASAFAGTPVAAGLFRSGVEDAAFTLLLLLAADAAQHAAVTARLRALVLSGVWVGAAFQTKMLEAWAVLPALAVTYLVAAPATLRRRLAHLALAGLVTIAVSASWIVVATLTPAHDRPYIDGTTDNSAFSMVVGYNFLNRFGSLGLTASGTGSVTSVRGNRFGPRVDRYGEPSSGASADPAGHGGRDSDEGWTKMFAPTIASQTGWLYPLAALAIVFGVAWRGRAARTDRLRAGFLMWGVWLVTFFSVFSAGSVGRHTYYMGVVAVPLAALSGAGTVLFWRAYQAGGRRAWVLPTAVGGTAAWCAALAREFSSFLPWLAPTVAGLGVVALAWLGAARLGGAAGRRVMVPGLVAGVAAMLLAPGAWATSVLNPKYRASGLGGVGPVGRHGPGFREFLAALPADVRAAFENRPAWGGDGVLTAQQRGLLAYLEAHRHGGKYLFAATRWHTASPYIINAGVSVLPMGGFTGQVPFPTLAQFTRLVMSGDVSYVVLGDDPWARFRAPTPAPTAAITSWVRSNCTLVPARAYGGAPQPARGTAAGSGGDEVAAAGQQLYRCAPVAG